MNKRSYFLNIPRCFTMLVLFVLLHSLCLVSLSERVMVKVGKQNVRIKTMCTAARPYIEDKLHCSVMQNDTVRWTRIYDTLALRSALLY
ncbi:hypothetical protein BX666DRAFT_1991284 [Dichotomocladium elegans]|nr:hypothetical protein BX666DRAFT_1991284 [Dichotomocladium elegans]